MSDPVSVARSARENLRQGLAALQAPGVPASVTQAAEPVAQAMGALHQIEASSGGALPQQAPLALEAVRRALGMLQAQPTSVPAVNQALEAVAGSLSLVHQLSQSVMATAATQMQQPSPVAPRAPAAAPAAWAGTHVMQPTGAQPAVPVGHPVPQQAHQQPQQQAYQQPQQQAYQQHPQQPYQQPQQQAYQQHPQQPQQQAYQQHPQQPYQQPQQQAYQQPPAQHPGPPNPQVAQAAVQPAPAAHAHAPPQQWQPAAMPGPAAPSGTPLLVEAELGAHSTTNFYKGLSGNDVIDSGGIFIATYKIPEIGQPLTIKVSLPGGYEFEAAGVVRWTRDAPHSTRGVESPPGFGAQFTNISQEGRQLVYRYVRNREPLFHDDL